MGNYITKNNLARFWEDCLSTFRMNGGQLLWQNPNPGEVFANQNITVPNISNYEYTIIGFKINNGSSNGIQYFKFKNVMNSYNYFDFIDGDGNTYHRWCQVYDNTTLKFDVGRFNTYNGSAQTDNSVCIPVAIYGTNDLGYIANASALDAHPIGSFYISSNSTSPASLFGGTWERIKDRFLLGAGDTYTAGDTGGEATHTLTNDEMPSHNHQLATARQYKTGTDTDSNPIKIGRTWQDADGWTGGFYTDNTGGGQPHNNMPPYLVVYMWKRTA